MKNLKTFDECMKACNEYMESVFPFNNFTKEEGKKLHADFLELADALEASCRKNPSDPGNTEKKKLADEIYDHTNRDTFMLILPYTEIIAGLYERGKKMCKKYNIKFPDFRGDTIMKIVQELPHKSGKPRDKWVEKFQDITMVPLRYMSNRFDASDTCDAYGYYDKPASENPSRPMLMFEFSDTGYVRISRGGDYLVIDENGWRLEYHNVMNNDDLPEIHIDKDTLKGMRPRRLVEIFKIKSVFI